MLYSTFRAALLHVRLFNSFLNVKALVDAFNQEKALVGAFSVLTNLRMELFQALVVVRAGRGAGAD